MNILVTGASGLIGSALVEWLHNRGDRALALRRAVGAARSEGPSWNPERGSIDLKSAGRLDAVVHLAGETIAQRWTPEAQARIRSSRVEGTQLLCKALGQLDPKPRVLVSASAVGFYGDRGNELLDEDSSGGSGFLADTARGWEGATEPAMTAGIRVVHLRIGIVLTPKGGALARMLPVFRLGLGGRLGSGQQYWSWISLDDLLRAIAFALDTTSLTGPVNAVSPGVVTNREFTRLLARALARPALLPVPGFAVKVLLGEMGSEALLGSTRTAPARLVRAGFTFHHAELGAALEAMLPR